MKPTQQEIIEVARESGIEWQRNTTITGKVRITTCGSQPVDKLERFATLLLERFGAGGGEPVAWMREGWGPDCGPYIEFYRDDEMGWRDRMEYTPLYTAPQPAKPAEQSAEHGKPVAWVEHEWSGTGLRHLHFEKREPTVRDEVVRPVWTPLYTHPSPTDLRAEYLRGLAEGFKEGWIECSKWAQRDDLIADIGSPSYEACVSAVKALKGKQ